MKKRKIEEFIDVFDQFVKSSLPQIKEEIDSVIAEGNPQEIERELDLLLGLVPNYSEIRKEYQRLNQYYATINPEAAEDYETDYQKAILE